DLLGEMSEAGERYLAQRVNSSPSGLVGISPSPDPSKHDDYQIPATHTATEDPPSHTEGETDNNIHEKPEEPKQSTDENVRFIGSSTYPPITKAQPITIIHPEPSVLQREGKGIATEDQAANQRKLVKASSIVRPNPDEPVRVEFVINGVGY
nr:hypothetical protein [Tanacetum cinerariifolium]